MKNGVRVVRLFLHEAFWANYWPSPVCERTVPCNRNGQKLARPRRRVIFWNSATAKVVGGVSKKWVQLKTIYFQIWSSNFDWHATVGRGLSFTFKGGPSTNQRSKLNPSYLAKQLGKSTVKGKHGCAWSLIGWVHWSANTLLRLTVVCILMLV